MKTIRLAVHENFDSSAFSAELLPGACPYFGISNINSVLCLCFELHMNTKRETWILESLRSSRPYAREFGARDVIF